MKKKKGSIHNFTVADAKRLQKDIFKNIKRHPPAGIFVFILTDEGVELAIDCWWPASAVYRPARRQSADDRESSTPSWRGCSRTIPWWVLRLLKTSRRHLLDFLNRQETTKVH